jgi:copper oxidase (laccase) domain-containing protein
VVGFGSRVGGVSEAPYDSLNIGVLTDDPGLRRGGREPAAALEEVDGHVVRHAGLAPLVLTADRLPVALAGPGGWRSSIAAGAGSPPGSSPAA